MATTAPLTRRDRGIDHGPLCNLPDRTEFLDLVDLAIGCGTPRAQLSVMVLDVDRLTQINDSGGHRLGDTLLRMLGTRIGAAMSAVRGTTRPVHAGAGHCGGGRFAIFVAHDRHAPSSETVRSQLLHALAKPFQLADREVYVTVSTGRSRFPVDGRDATTLLTRAEAALRSAKRTGRNSHHTYRPTRQTGATISLSLETELQRAVRQQEFRLVYQPKVEMTTRRIVGAEALLRWRHPTRGLLAPRAFMPLAEEMGLTVPIGHWVIRQAAAQCARWQARTNMLIPIAINLSSAQIQHGQVTRQITQATAEHSLGAAALEVEITEQVIMQNQQSVQRTVRRLREAGIRVAIDDFGTGYSSLSAIKEIPFDILKIDQVFVRDVAQEDSDRTLAGAIIDIGRRLGVTVIAEGVETEEQLQALGRYPCHEAQGFLFGQPVPGHVFESHLTERLV